MNLLTDKAYLRESFCGVVANVLNCNIIVRQFELQSRYNVHFRTNTLEKVLIHNLSSHGLRSITTFLGGARGVMVIVVGNGRGDTSSNPGRG